MNFVKVAKIGKNNNGRGPSAAPSMKGPATPAAVVVADSGARHSTGSAGDDEVAELRKDVDFIMGKGILVI